MHIHTQISEVCPSYVLTNLHITVHKVKVHFKENAARNHYITVHYILKQLTFQLLNILIHATSSLILTFSVL